MVSQLLYRFIPMLFILFTSRNVVAQQSIKPVPKIFYKRMEGSVGNNRTVISNLKQAGKKIDGNYFFIKPNGDSSTTYGHPVDVYGQLSTQSKLVLKKQDNNKPVFTGIFKDDRFNGQYSGPEDHQQYFMLHENYPDGSIPLEVHYLQSEESMERGNPHAPYAKIKLTLLVPRNYRSVGELNSIYKSICRAYFGDNFSENNPDSLLISFETEFYNQFKAQNKLWKTSPQEAFNWQRAVDMSVAFNSNGLLCLEYLRHGYSGSGHPVSRISYQLFDLKTGKQLSANGLFKPDAFSKLSHLLTQKLRKKYGIADSLALKKAGFFVDKVNPNSNLYFGGNGIGFVFNNYELAPPAMGIIDLFLPFDEIKPLLRQHSGLPF